MKDFLTWLKGLFTTSKSPAQVVIDYALEADIMAKREALRREHLLYLEDLADYKKFHEQKKRASDAWNKAKEHRNTCIALELELAELEKRRG